MTIDSLAAVSRAQRLRPKLAFVPTTPPQSRRLIDPSVLHSARSSRVCIDWRRVGGTLVVGLYGFGILFALGGGTELLRPDHRMIGVAHLPLLALFSGPLG